MAVLSLKTAANPSHLMTRVNSPLTRWVTQRVFFSKLHQHPEHSVAFLGPGFAFLVPRQVVLDCAPAAEIWALLLYFCG